MTTSPCARLEQVADTARLSAQLPLHYTAPAYGEGPDGGVDIVAHKDELGFEPPIVKVQVKSTTGSVGDPEVSSLYGKVANGEFGLLVTLGTFTSKATSFAKSKSNLRLIDGEELVRLIYHHYDQFDSRYKGLLPLRRVYVPEALDSEDE
jgi:restriction system protein